MARANQRNFGADVALGAIVAPNFGLGVGVSDGVGGREVAADGDHVGVLANADQFR